ncbi:MAG: preprotein translocase subunit SecG [Pseudomonadota bacterium]
MDAVVLVIHLMLALALIAVVLVQQSEGGGLGIGGGSGGGMGGLATARGTANLLTRLTAILAFGFLITSLSLAILAKDQVSSRPDSILELAEDPETDVPVSGDSAVTGDDQAAEGSDNAEAADVTEGDEAEAVNDNGEDDAETEPKQEPAVPISE